MITYPTDESVNSYVFSNYWWALPLPSNREPKESSTESSDFDSLIQGKSINPYSDKAVLHDHFEGFVEPSGILTPTDEGTQVVYDLIWKPPTSDYQELIPASTGVKYNGVWAFPAQHGAYYHYGYFEDSVYASEKCFLYRKHSIDHVGGDVWVAYDFESRWYPGRRSGGSMYQTYYTTIRRLTLNKWGKVECFSQTVNRMTYDQTQPRLLTDVPKYIQEKWSAFIQNYCVTAVSGNTLDSDPASYSGYSVTNDAISDEDRWALASVCQALLNEMQSLVIPDYNQKCGHVLATLSTDLANEAREFNVNSISLAIETAGIPNEIRDTLSLMTNFSPDAIPALYLSYLYGLRLTVKDLQELAALQDKVVHTVRGTTVRKAYASATIADSAGSINYSVDIHRKMYYDPVDTGLRGLCEKNYAYSVFTMENVWDMIPFSFVIDWFWDVSDLWRAVDNAAYLQILDITSLIGSEKFQIDRQKRLPSGRKVTCRMVRYQRGLRQMVIPSFSGESSGITNHIPEATCIVAEVVT